MSRMAAKFTTDAAPGGGSTGGTSSKPKKFSTRGEDFFDFLKNIGYQPPRHQQYEHFEYLFQDEKSNMFARRLMSTLKTQNRLLPDEIQRFETLQKQGLVLYGADLEEAVSRRHTINELYSVQMQRKQEKTEQLKSAVQSSKEEMEKLKELETIFQNETSDAEIKCGKIINIHEIMSHLKNENEKEMEIDLQLLQEKMSDLERAIFHLKQNSQKGSANYLCQVNGKLLLEREENIYESVQDLIRKHGKNLISKEVGYEVEGDPFHEENIRKIFAQFEMDFDRLKHCIIYERVKMFGSELDLAGQQGRLENFEDIYNKAVHLASLDCTNREKIKDESNEVFKKSAVCFRQEQDELIDLVRERTLAAVNHQFSALTNIKARSKRKLQQFFTFLTNVMRAQKVRITLIRHLIKDEAKLYSRLLSNIEENLAISNSHLQKTSSPKVSGVTLEGQILSSLLKYFAINQPLDIIACAHRAYAVLNKCLLEVDKSYWNIMESKQTWMQNSFKQICKTEEALHQVHQSVTEASVLTCTIDDAEARIKKRELELKNFQQTRNALAKDHHHTRKACMEKMKNILRPSQNIDFISNLSVG